MTGRKQEFKPQRIPATGRDGIAGAVLAGLRTCRYPLSAPAGAGYSGARHRCDNRAFGRNGCPAASEGQASLEFVMKIRRAGRMRS